MITKRISKNSKITLEKNEILTDDAKIAETFNTWNIEKDESILCDTGNETEPVKIAIKKIQETPNHFKDKTIKNPTEFYLAPIDEDLIAKAFQNLN